ncbi:MAG: IS4 family transposase [Syntrophales bacterium LBB04]|nr:IS4 family transposase [Syntrophales bacterium LBB04]
MYTGKIIFSQIMDFIPWYEFQKCVEKYSGNYKIKNFSCTDQFLCMAFAQLTYRESLRDIESCLHSMTNKTYHMGIRSKISRSTLADANNNRDWRIYAEFAQILIGTARKLYANDDFGLDLSNTVYALDSSTIDLCLSLFPWAQFRKNKGAVKLHTLLDLRGNIPTFIEITDGKVGDVNILDILTPEAGAFYIMDRGYIDYMRLYFFHQFLSFFITRAKSNIDCRRIYSQPIDKETGLKYDQTIMLTGIKSAKEYPEKLRRVKYYDEETEKMFIFLTNNFSLPALIIAKLYKCRWQIELFFKWIKQHLRIKAFYGTSENAVKSQIWIAVSVYVLIAIIIKQLNIELSLYTILQIFSVTIFEKMPILQALEADGYKNENIQFDNQLQLFNL